MERVSMDDASASASAAAGIVLVTGPSGAGRSTAVKALEDLGCETIDNLPLSLVPRLLDGPARDRRLVLGIDVRNRDFSVAACLELLEWLRGRDDSCELLYLDCAAPMLTRRYSETRRRHPMAPAETPEIGIAREIDLLRPIRAAADLLIDTSDLTPHDLKGELARWFGPGGAQRLALTLHSFSYKRGMPRGLDMVFDCRFLANPYWSADLRPRDGRDAAVGRYIADDERFAGFFERVADLAAFLLPAYRDEGKAHLSIGFGCTGGQHRSVYLAETLAARLRGAGWPASLHHHEIERRARAAEAAR